MDKRSAKILSAIVDEYVRSGEPIGSKALAERLELGVSSATIRNIMAALEQEGYLDHPHTSAGRVPTYKGFRYYIENLMSPEPINPDKISEIDRLLGDSAVTDEAIIENASAALAEITKCAAISTNHASKFSVITKVDVIPTGKRMYVLLLIASNGAIKNKVCRMEFDMTDEQTADFTRFLNEHLSGVNLENMSEEYISGLTAALGGYMLSLAPLLHAVYELSEEMMRDSVEVKGEENLLACTEFPARDVIRFIERKSELSNLLNDALSGINIMFGEENGTFAISNGAMVSASYYKDGKPAGSLGIVGPMRLDYRKVIPYIEYLSRKVTRMLSGSSQGEGVPQIEREVDGNNDK
ncbi:MAG: heat-inducible transcriptional repressor HrcA [Lachnospiraceae bacterium]|nr:heat-inducible transcriptional repressor HrcA [Ruminococcus sp.]MCM1274150.1 heat-inducible transcriptional repressor HrcA [Lachnospiraceae bacterium]